MHVHLPKPIHGWRQFFGEVGIIVLGVLIALAAEQAVEAVHWEHRVAAIRNSLTGELSNDRARWEWDVASTSCAARQIDALDRWIALGRTDQPMPNVSAITVSALFPWMHSANWSLATASGAFDHFPIDEQLSYAALYDGIAHRQTQIEKITDVMGQITALLPLARDEKDRRDLQVSLAALKSQLTSLTTDAGYMSRHFDALGIKPDRSDFAADIKASGCAQ